MAKNRKSNSKGFTLIELLIVIIIIGILAAIAFVAYGSSTNKAKKADAQSTVAQVKEKLGVYETDNGNFPKDKATLTTWLSSASGGNSGELSTKFGGSGYSYTATPSGCDNSATQCSGFSITASASTLGYGASPADDVTAGN